MSTESGVKFDDGKLMYSLIPPESTKELAKVLTFGANKYTPGGWKDVPNARTRYMDALFRHLDAWRMGETYDEESGLNHLSHALTNLNFLVYFEQQDLKRLQMEIVARNVMKAMGQATETPLSRLTEFLDTGLIKENEEFEWNLKGNIND